MGSQTRHFYRDASQRLSFDIDVEANEFPSLCASISAAFSLSPVGEPFLTPDLLVWDYESDGKVIEFSWDIWSCFSVIAKVPEAEEIVRRIAEWYDAQEKHD